MAAIALILVLAIGLGLAASRLGGWWEPLLIAGILAIALLQFTVFGPS